MTDFKVGDKVRLNPVCKHFAYGRAGVLYDEIGEIINIKCNGEIRINFPSHSSWSGKQDEIILDKIFNKNDLQDGDIVTLRNGDKLRYDNERFEDINYYNCNNLDYLSELNFNMTYYDRDQDKNDIIKVERPTYHTVFERVETEPKKMTVKEICEALGYDVEIVKEAKDND